MSYPFEVVHDIIPMDPILVIYLQLREILVAVTTWLGNEHHPHESMDRNGHYS